MWEGGRGSENPPNKREIIFDSYFNTLTEKKLRNSKRYKMNREVQRQVSDLLIEKGKKLIIDNWR